MEKSAAESRLCVTQLPSSRDTSKNRAGPYHSSVGPLPTIEDEAVVRDFVPVLFREGGQFRMRRPFAPSGPGRTPTGNVLPIPQEIRP